MEHFLCLYHMMKDVLSLKCPYSLTLLALKVLFSTICKYGMMRGRSNLHHWEYKECIFYLQVNIQTACIVFWHFKMGNSQYPESCFNEFFWHRDPSMLEGFFFSWLQGTKTFARLHQAVITWCHQLLLKNKFYAGGGKIRAIPEERSVSSSQTSSPPYICSSIIYPGLHHSTPQISLWSSSPWYVYRHTINFSTLKINGHAAELQLWKCIPLLRDKPTWHQVLPHDDLQGLKITSAKNRLLPGTCFFFQKL